jgi:uncharacterized protein (DUF1778 family)
MAEHAANNKEDRLSIRANSQQKAFLSQAASARHMNVSQFVLQASLREAEHVIQEETVIKVSAEEYEWISKVMDAATPAPRLREALKEKPVWDVKP